MNDLLLVELFDLETLVRGHSRSLCHSKAWVQFHICLL